ncbi:hypothetical protein K6V96_06015 [Streptococcus suis]|uniref:Sugar isomerase n=3 Tax=Streptococcus suis TaxID=1307 RepID=A0AA87F969_STRSU|nr:hypothetical protein [Streptococcus suis]ATZ03410.1 hypothetical protein CVO91_05455 [Streptococcus suis]EHC03231.1 hypothetical protein SSUR61_0751 [Streptococcus suis R61]MBY5000807.1 hypothetical protein [Streptococcus suis]MBY5011894.1 hypothetical protein [Streptococcus suis]MBY5014724.1 hypothetical protein [Streptococcus suis]
MREKRNIVLNLLAAIVLQIVTILVAFIVPKLLISTYGPQMHGFITTITNLITYLMLVEAGIASSSIQGLYKPLVSKEERAINAGLNAIGHFYVRIGVTFSALLIALALIYPLIVKSSWDYQIVFAIIIASGLAQLLEYFFGSKYRILLQADKRLYILNIINIIAVLSQGGLRIVLMLQKVDILWVQLVPAVVYLLKLLLIVIYVRRHYHFLDKTTKPNFQVTANRWNVFIHQITNLVVNNTDGIVLSIAKGYSIVSVYSIYNLVISNINGFFSQSFTNSITANLGHLYVSSGREVFAEEYRFFEKIYYILIALVLGICCFALLPFIRLYVGEVDGINYVNFWIMVLFLANALVTNLRTPLLTVVMAVGAFKETQNFAIIESLLNLSLSLLLVKDYGIYGVLFATLCSSLYRYSTFIKYVNRHILHRSPVHSLKTGIIAVLEFFIPVIIGNALMTKFVINGWGQLFLLCAVTGVISLMLIIMVIALLDRSFFKRCVSLISR